MCSANYQHIYIYIYFYLKPSVGSGSTGFYPINLPPEPTIWVLLERDPNPTHHGLWVHLLGLGSVGPGRFGQVFYPVDSLNCLYSVVSSLLSVVGYKFGGETESQA